MDLNLIEKEVESEEVSLTESIDFACKPVINNDLYRMDGNLRVKLPDKCLVYNDKVVYIGKEYTPIKNQDIINHFEAIGYECERVFNIQNKDFEFLFLALNENIPKAYIVKNSYSSTFKTTLSSAVFSRIVLDGSFDRRSILPLSPPINVLPGKSNKIISYDRLSGLLATAIVKTKKYRVPFDMKFSDKNIEVKKLFEPYLKKGSQGKGKYRKTCIKINTVLNECLFFEKPEEKMLIEKAFLYSLGITLYEAKLTDISYREYSDLYSYIFELIKQKTEGESNVDSNNGN